MLRLVLYGNGIRIMERLMKRNNDDDEFTVQLVIMQLSRKIEQEKKMNENEWWVKAENCCSGFKGLAFWIQRFNFEMFDVGLQFSFG